MDGEQPRVPVHGGQPARLRDLGYDERWLQDWLVAKPTRLGLGEVVIVTQELSHPKGGSLDILAADGDTYYSIEVQLGEVDASHGFRVFDYWARNRARYADKTHVAVLLVESAEGRFRQALQALAEYVPLVVVGLRVWRGASEAVIVPEPLIVNNTVDVGGTVGQVEGKTRTEQDWREQLTDEAWTFHEVFVAWTREHLGEVRVDYSPKSYIGCGVDGASGRRFGLAVTGRVSGCPIPTGHGPRSRRLPSRPSTSGFATKALSQAGNEPTTQAPTPSACGFDGQIWRNLWCRSCCEQASRPSRQVCLLGRNATRRSPSTTASLSPTALRLSGAIAIPPADATRSWGPNRRVVTRYLLAADTNPVTGPIGDGVAPVSWTRLLCGRCW